MIIKLDGVTEIRLNELRKEVRLQTGMTPQSVSLMVQVLLKWALDSIKPSTIGELAPSMLTLSQQRKAVVGEVLAVKGQLNQTQIKQ